MHGGVSEGTCAASAARPYARLRAALCLRAFVDGRLAAMASTHFATTDVIEIGNIVTHPGYRRRGLASACTSALVESCFGLASRVYLMVLAENDAAFNAYRALGFWPSERFAFVHFRLSGAG